MIREDVSSFSKHFLVFDVIELSVTYDFTLLFFQGTDRSLISISEPLLSLNFGTKRSFLNHLGQRATSMKSHRVDRYDNSFRHIFLRPKGKGNFNKCKTMPSTIHTVSLKNLIGINLIFSFRQEPP